MAMDSFDYRPGATSNVVVLDHSEPGTPSRYEQALAEQRGEPLGVRARIEVLLRKRDELAPFQDVVRHLYVEHENAAARVAALSERQRQVMDLVLEGRRSKIIAWELGISQRTVEVHRAAIMKRTGVKSLPALARLALAAGHRASM